MITGLTLVLIGILIAIHPQIFVFMIAGLFVLFGLGMMAASWQFRRMRRESHSKFMNWIIRY